MEQAAVHAWFGDYLDACNRHDLGAVRSLVDAGVRRAHLPGGADAWVADLADLFTAFPDWRWKRIQLLVDDDRLAVHLRASGTHLGEFRGRAATRRHVNVAEFGFYRLAGSPARVVEYTGTGEDAVLAQIGA